MKENQERNQFDKITRKSLNSQKGRSMLENMYNKWGEGNRFPFRAIQTWGQKF